MDRIDEWCKSSGELVDCSELLNAWNLFGDLPRGENLCGCGFARRLLYDKLFRGCNLPAMTPAGGEHYVPSWNASEIAALKRVLLLGLAEFRGRLR